MTSNKLHGLHNHGRDNFDTLEEHSPMGDRPSRANVTPFVTFGNLSNFIFLAGTIKLKEKFYDWPVFSQYLKVGLHLYVRVERKIL